MTKTINDIKPKVSGLAQTARAINHITTVFISKYGQKISIKYIGGECVSYESMDKCTNPDCSWFNHSQVGLR